MKANICATSIWARTVKEKDKKLLKEYGDILKGYCYEDGTIDICSLKQLAKLARDLDKELIIGSDDNLNLCIEIYDDYRE